MVMAPAVGRAVHTRAQHVESAASQSVSQVGEHIARWGDRLVEAIVRSGEQVVEDLPTQPPQPWSVPAPAAPAPDPSVLPPAPLVYPWSWRYPVTIFRQQTWRRGPGRMGRL